MTREEELRARPGHEDQFRAAWELRPEAKGHPLWEAAYEWAATHRLTVAEINRIGPMLVSRRPMHPVTPELSKARPPGEPAHEIIASAIREYVLEHGLPCELTPAAIEVISERIERALFGRSTR